MIDITNEIAGIQAAVTGSQIRSAIINALSALNNALPSFYNGPYSITPSTSGFSVATSGFAMTSDLFIEAYPGASLISATFSENGAYNASSFSADGFDEIIVSIPSAVLISHTFSENGSYYASDYSADGFSEINIDVSNDQLPWNENFCLNWDFRDPINTRESSSYIPSASNTFLSAIDGWRMYNAQMSIVSNGIVIGRYMSNVDGYFMQRFVSRLTSQFVNKTMHITGIVDGMLAHSAITMPSGNSGTSRFWINDVAFRIYNYGNEVEITIDATESTHQHVVQAFKLEFGDDQTLGHLEGDTYVPNLPMDKPAETAKIKSGLLLVHG